MKKVIAIFLICCIGIQSIFFAVLFIQHKFQYNNRFLSPKNTVALIIPISEYSNVKFFEKDEIEYKLNFYDVISIEKTGTNITIIAKLDKVDKQIHSFSKKEHQHKKYYHNNILYNLYCASISNFTFHNFQLFSKNKLRDFDTNILENFLSIKSPPPNYLL